MMRDIDPSHVDGSWRLVALGRARRMVQLTALAVALAIGWAAVAQIDEITRGDGRVIPLRRMQTIASLEGGILAELKVAEGDVVARGQSVALLDPTRSRAAFQAAEAQIGALRAEIARLEAEVLEQPRLDYGPEPDAAEVTELRLFAARRQRLEASLAALGAEREALDAQLRITEPLAEGGSVSRVEMLQLRQQLAGVDGKIGELRNGYVQDAYKDLAERRAKLASLEQEIVQKRDEFERTEVRSPVDGRINNIEVTTMGGVVQPGAPIMEITPLDDQLLIETKVLPRDVAFIAPGMPASVKITAYDFSIYGDLRGSVTQISEDTVEEETANGPQDFYRVMVRTERAHLERYGETLPIRPGMLAEVDIESGKRSVLSYLTRPLFRARLR